MTLFWAWQFNRRSVIILMKIATRWLMNNLPDPAIQAQMARLMSASVQPVPKFVILDNGMVEGRQAITLSEFAREKLCHLKKFAMVQITIAMV